MNLSEELTIRTIDKTVNEFIDEFSSGKTVVIKSGSIEKIDIAGIQFLLSVIKLSQENKSKIQLDISIGAESKALMNRNGFAEMFKYFTNK